MDNFLNDMVKRITSKKEGKALARFHVLSISLAMPILFVVSTILIGLYLGKVLTFSQIELIVSGFLAVALELIIIGLVSIGIRAVEVKELAFMGGSTPQFVKGKRARDVGYGIVISVTVLQVFIIWNIFAFIAYWWS